MVTRGCLRRPVRGESERVSVERRGGGHYRGGVRKQGHVANGPARGAARVGIADILALGLLIDISSADGRERAAGDGGCQEHGQPLWRADDGVVDLRQLACRARLGVLRGVGGAEGGGDADEDERAEVRGVLLRL